MTRIWRVRSAVSIGGGPTNEDRVGVSGRLAWVIDGATSLSGVQLFTGPSDAAWLAGRISDYLHRHAADDAPVSELLSRAIEHVDGLAHSLGVSNRAAFPSASVAVVRLMDWAFEFCLLGDCTLLVQQSGSIARMMDPQYAGREERLRATLEKALAAGATVEVAYGAAHNDAVASRLARNSPAGTWIVRRERDAAQHSLVGSRSIAPGDRVALASDGLMRAVDLFPVLPAAQLIDSLAHDHDVMKVIRSIRDWEDRDPDGVAFPRLKKSDDASWLLLEGPGEDDLH